MFNVYFYGPLRVLVCASSGAVVAVQDRISGMAAAFQFSPDYIRVAEQFALHTEQSLYSEV